MYVESCIWEYLAVWLNCTYKILYMYFKLYTPISCCLSAEHQTTLYSTTVVSKLINFTLKILVNQQFGVL